MSANSELEQVEIPCECRRCQRCDGSGVEDWYLGDEFNSTGSQTCGTCGGSGVIEDDCPLHHDSRSQV
jgi:hypothetical protein